MNLTHLVFPLAAAVCLGALSSEAAAPDPGRAELERTPKLVSAAEAADLIAARKVVVLDVRTPAEFATGHIAGAANLDFNGPHFQEELAKLDKGRAYLVYCAVGGRSAKASRRLSELNFKSVYDLQGGIKAWEKARKPVVK